MAKRMGGTVAFGRAVAAGRMLLGLDQGMLGVLAGVSGATISNVERGNVCRPQTKRVINTALKAQGVHIIADKASGIVSAQLGIQ